MGKIFAIGGGEIGRKRPDGTKYPVETTAIDKALVKLSGKSHPKLLFIPTASGDSEAYFEVVKKHFGKLGCKCDVLYMLKQPPSRKRMESAVSNSDILYVGGGNTMRMLQVWKRVGFDKVLLNAYRSGKILSGVSAGAICWFKYSTSDSKPNSAKNNYGIIRLSGLNFLPLTVSPHNLREPKRMPALMKIMKRTPGIAVAVDDCAALEILDSKFKILSCKKDSHAYKVYKSGSKIRKPRLPKGTFMPISFLFSKKQV